MESRPQITPLFPNDVLMRLERMRINPACRNTSRHRGEQLAGRGGSNTEFSDYRDYAPGDDTRFIDWNIFSRLHRPYLKIFRLEEEMHVLVIVDASSSMLFDGKLDLAKRVGAAFGVMGLYGGQRVSVYTAGCENTGGRPGFLRPRHGRSGRRDLFTFVEGIEGGGAVPLEKGVDNVMKFHKGKGVAVLLSDFLTFGNLSRTFNTLFSMGLETYAIQILSPAELNPEINGDSRLVDCESEHTLDITEAGDLLAIYHEHKDKFIALLEKMSKQRSGRFITVSSDSPVQAVLFDMLLKRGWIK